MVIPTASELLATLASFGSADKEEANKAYQAGLRKLGVSKMSEIPSGEVSIERLDSILFDLAASTANVKETLIRACLDCVNTDGQVTIEEAELLRAISDALECPVPPFLG